MKNGLALLRDVKCFVGFLGRICIHHVANLGRDNIFEQDVALEVSLQNAMSIFK